MVVYSWMYSFKAFGMNVPHLLICIWFWKDESKKRDRNSLFGKSSCSEDFGSKTSNKVVDFLSLFLPSQRVKQKLDGRHSCHREICRHMLGKSRLQNKENRWDQKWHKKMVHYASGLWCSCMNFLNSYFVYSYIVSSPCQRCFKCVWPMTNLAPIFP